MRQVFISLLLLPLLCGCTNNMHDDIFAYRTVPFRAEISGTLYGTPFSAEIGIQQTDTGSQRYIRFLSPSSLKGITVTVNESGDASAGLGEVCFDGHATDLRGLLLPINILFEEDSYQTIQKSNEGTEIKLASGNILQINAKGIPTHVRGGQINYDVLWWEPIKP